MKLDIYVYESRDYGLLNNLFKSFEKKFNKKIRQKISHKYI